MNSRLGAIFVAIILLSTTGGVANATTMSDAESLLLDSKFIAAENAYRDLINQDTSGDAYAGLAVSLAKQAWPKKIIEAERILRVAKQKYSTNSNVMAAAGYVSYVHSQTVASPAKRDLYLDAGETLCERAIKVNPDIEIAQQTLGMIKLAQDDPEGAETALRKACKLVTNAANLTLLAQAILKIDPKDKEANDLINRALSLNDEYYPAYLQKALILATQGKQEDAFMELKNIPEDARNSQWHEIEGRIYRKQGDGPAALAAWNEAIRLDPHNSDPYKHLAEYYALRGDGELAISELHNALEILPNDTPLRTQLAELALRQDKLDVAETEYKTILASVPDDQNALLGLSRVYFRKARKEGQYPPGWQQLMDQLQNISAQTNVEGKILKGGAKQLQENIELNEAEKALSQNRFKDARQHFSTVINSHRDDPYALLTLGDQAYNDGDLRSAEEAYTFAKEIDEVSSRAEQGLAKIVVQRNEASRQITLGDATHSLPEVAEDHYKQALIADPQCSQAYLGLFNLFNGRKSPDPQKALDYGQSFLESADDSNSSRKAIETEVEKLKQKVDKVDKDKGKAKKK